MHKDIQIGGVLITAFVGYLLAAFIILMLLRRLVFRPIRLGRYVANQPLAEAGIFVCVLALLIALL